MFVAINSTAAKMVCGATPRMRRQFPGVPTASTSARAFLRAALQTWELDGLGEVTELLTSELVSNIVRHVGSAMTVRALRQPSRIRLEVDDPNPEPPVLKRPEPRDPRGRGILLVDTLADNWGTEVSDDGKTVWFEIDARTAPEEIHISE